MQVGEVGRHKDPITVAHRDLAADAHGQRIAERGDIYVKECVGAEVFGHAHRALPGAGFIRDAQMFGTDPDGGGAMRFGLCAGDEVHLGRADEACDEQVAGAAVEVERGADLFNPARL